MYHLFILFLWYSDLAMIYEKSYKSFIFWAIWACKFVYLLNIIFEKAKKLGFKLATLLNFEILAT